jgi:hypothetical protein
VVKVEPDSPITAEEKAFVQKLGLDRQTKDSLLTGRASFFRVTLDRAMALPMGSLIAAANCEGNGFLVQGCNFGYNRSRGILIKASHGQVLNNTITHGWMAGVLVSPEFWWFESGSSSDVVIAGNKIIGCRQSAIQVVAPGGSGAPLASGAHRDITISSNTISASVWPNIRVTSTARLVVRGNQLTPVQAEPAGVTGSKRRAGNGENARPISIEDCAQPELQAVP